MEELLSELIEGNEQSFAEIFEAFYKKVFNFYFYRTNNDREAAKDLTQLVFIKLWNSKHTLSSAYTLDRQIFLMARNVLIDHVRKEAVKQKRTTSLNGEIKEQTSNGADFQTVSFENNNYVSSVIKQLPPVRKKVLQMKILYGYSNKEIAGMLSISPKTVEDHVTKGLNELRHRLSVPAAFAFFFLLNQSLLN
jgi:RNA polymerase sigma factor, sigma-70 family